jgi:carboxymethylenebutenolidase
MQEVRSSNLKGFSVIYFEWGERSFLRSLGKDLRNLFIIHIDDYCMVGTPDDALGAVFDEHVKCEFVTKDVEATMKTMIKEPYVHHVPILTGGIGYEGVYNYYKNDFIGKMPDDVKVTPLSRTVGKNQVVDELFLSFTHDRELRPFLPGIQPTGKFVEIPMVVVMRFEGNKIVYEHIYWDQASVLTQIGLIDEKNLPVKGIEQSQRLRELSSM